MYAIRSYYDLRGAVAQVREAGHEDVDGGDQDQRQERREEHPADDGDSQRPARLAVGVDSLDGARSLGGPIHAAGRVLDVLLKVDVGYGRVGVRPEDAPALAERLAVV